MRKPYRTARPNPRLLEPRMVFDAAAAAVATDLATETVQAFDLTRSIDDTGSLLMQQSQSLPVEPSRQIAFVDAALLKDGTVPGLAAGVELVALQPDTDGIAQIGAALAGRSDISAIYIVSHGGTGSVTLGSTELDNATLAAHAADIASWAPHLSSGADILLYGCQVGSGGDGMQLLQSLADLTGADIAASTNNTGPASLGGDWTLEASTGVIEAQGFASADALVQFDALLNVNVASNSLTGWVAVTPANNQNDATNDQQTGSGSVSQDIVGDATYRAAYVKYDNGGTAADLSDDWLAFRVRVNNQDNNSPASPTFKNFTFFGVDADGNGSIDFFAGVYNPANNAGRIGVYDANGAGNTGPSDTGINGTPAIKYDSTTTGYNSLYSVLATGDGSNFSGDTDYFVSFQVKIADINASKATFGLTSNITQSTVMRYIVGTAAQDNAFNQDVSGITGGYMSSTLTWTQLGAYTAPLQTDGSVALAASADYASATEKGGTSNGSAGVDPTGSLLTNDSGTGITVTKVQSGSTVGASASTLTAGSTSTTNATTVSGSYGTLTIGADGSYSYAVNNANTTVQALRTSTDTLIDTFSYRITDSAAGTSDATLTVTLHGADDAPVITSGSSGSVAENAAITTAIYTVAASDVDSGDTKTYSLKSGVGDQSLLNIDAATGAVTLKTSADFEAKSSYAFTVVVTDIAGLTDEKAVTVAVTNVNEAPVATNDTALATEKGGTANGTTGIDPTGDVLANDTDVDAGDTKTVSAIRVGSAGTTGTVGQSLAGSYGSLTLNADGSYSYAVNNANTTVQALRTSSDTLTDTFTYTMRDTAGQTSTATLAITIRGADDAPVITSGSSGSIAENAAASTVIYTVAASDVDSGDTKTYSLKSGTGDESLLNINTSTGAVTLKASADYESKSSYSFTVVATDTAGLTDEKAVTVAVTNVNEAPVANADTALATEKGGTANGTVGVDPSGNVLSNDSDVDAGDTKTVSAVRVGSSGTVGTVGQSLAGSYGSLTLNADGSYSYAVNNANATVQALRTSSDTLTETYSYTMRDTAGLTSTATLTITIRGADDAPAITSGSSGSIAENSATTTAIYTVAASDVDSGDTKTYSLKSGVGDEALLDIDTSSGAVRLKAAADFETKSSYSFTVVATDTAGLTDEKVVTVAVTNVNEAPVANTDTALATEKGGIANGTVGVDPSGNLLTNDSDVDGGDTKTVTAISFGGSGGTVGQALQGSYGALTVNANGSYSYVVNNANATVQALRTSGDTLTETFSYTMRDTAGLTSSSTLTVTIRGANDAPLAAADGASATESGASGGTDPTGNVLANDTDVDGGDTKTVNAIRVGSAGTVGTVGQSLAGSYGSLTLDADGSYRYVVDNANATVDALNAGGTLNDSFSYTVADDDGLTSTSTLTITIHGANDAPVPSAVSAANATVGEAMTPVTVPAFADVDNGTLSYSATQSDGSALPSWLSFDAATRTFSGTPPAGSAATLTLRVSGSDGSLSDHADFSLVVADPAAPQAADDAGDANEAGGVANGTAGSDASGTVLANDSGSRLTVARVDAGNALGNGAMQVSGQNATDIAGGHGTLSLHADGSFAYEVANGNAAVQALNVGDTLTDTFSYEVTDQAGQTSTAVITITIHGANDAPVASAMPTTAATNGQPMNPFTVPVFSDVDNATLNYSATLSDGNPLPSWLSFDTITRTFSGTPPSTFTGTLGICISGDDGLADAKLHFNLVVVNPGAPVAFDDSGSATEAGAAAGSNASGDLLGNDAGTTISVNAIVAGNQFSGSGTAVSAGSTLAGGATHIDGHYGTLFIAADGGYRYELRNASPAVDALNAGDTLTDSFAYQMGDPSGQVATALLTITINGANDAPVASAVSAANATVGEAMTPVTVPAFTDVDSAHLSYAATLSDGSALPSWLSFDSTTRTFSGTPPAGSMATLSLRVSGSDGSLSEHVDFNLVVANPAAPDAGNDAADATEASGVANGTAGSDASGNALANDSGSQLVVTHVGAGHAAGSATLQVAGANATDVTGSHGTLSLRADGSYSYRVAEGDAAVQALNVGHTLTDTFSYEVTDQAGQTSTATITITIHGANDAPVAAAITTSPITGGTAMPAITVPAFADVDNARLSYTATLADGSPLPGWLNFNAATRTFRGTPPATAGTLAIRVAGDDGQASDSVTFNLVINSPATQPQTETVLPPVVTAPVIVPPAPPVPIQAPVEAPRLPEPTPIARATTSVSPSVPLELGKLQPVEQPGPMDELYTDSRGFRVVVMPSNVQELSVFRGISDQFVERGSDVKFNLPQDAFVHARPDQVVRLSARQADGSPLPAWLQFDAANGSFAGTPPKDFRGEVRISVVARDGAGSEAAALFRLNVEEQRSSDARSDSFSTSMRDALPFAPAMPPLPELPPEPAAGNTATEPVAEPAT